MSARGNEPFTTIDDLQKKARHIFSEFEEIVLGLNRLGNYKHPLDVRRGIRKGVIRLSKNSENSKTVKASSKTYFFDILKAKNGNSYLKISESRFKGAEKSATRNSIIVFVEDAHDFADAVSDMVLKLDQQKKQNTGD